ncbi:hypothetical protein BDBG_05780 [Blastomyces gilchristii SLH14081]|uniref:Uncharacterized protein n=2 Tax=Blastomyces TaxID=229219 RepID=A0A179US83_BLAGS|nr:uncharacterized protein BDBG_05780 [Blastomyces gilchristii SLH14081]EGE78066.2 hypothetical protein BDDG_01003 [Blastomyces dermatitidis ATCC 18188]OAT10099.1 hypothetical protein BDBG_05780 [Blastomyces gilchristii SLH14081]
MGWHMFFAAPLILIGLGHHFRRPLTIIHPRLGPSRPQKVVRRTARSQRGCRRLGSIMFRPRADRRLCRGQKVIFNVRRDMDKWHASAMKHLCEEGNEKWALWLLLVPPERGCWSGKVEDGWEPVCKFLGKEVPHGQPFPRANDAAGLVSGEG